jgi:hypothetical protein
MGGRAAWRAAALAGPLWSGLSASSSERSSASPHRRSSASARAPRRALHVRFREAPPEPVTDRARLVLGGRALLRGCRGSAPARAGMDHDRLGAGRARRDRTSDAARITRDRSTSAWRFRRRRVRLLLNPGYHPRSSGGSSTGWRTYLVPAVAALVVRALRAGGRQGTRVGEGDLLGRARSGRSRAASWASSQIFVWINLASRTGSRRDRLCASRSSACRPGTSATRSPGRFALALLVLGMVRGSIGLRWFSPRSSSSRSARSSSDLGELRDLPRRVARRPRHFPDPFQFSTSGSCSERLVETELIGSLAGDPSMCAGRACRPPDLDLRRRRRRPRCRHARAGDCASRRWRIPARFMRCGSPESASSYLRACAIRRLIVSRCERRLAPLGRQRAYQVTGLRWTLLDDGQVAVLLERCRLAPGFVRFSVRSLNRENDSDCSGRAGPDREPDAAARAAGRGRRSGLARGSPPVAAGASRRTRQPADRQAQPDDGAGVGQSEIQPARNGDEIAAGHDCLTGISRRSR